MMPGLVVTHTNNVGILECLTSMSEQDIIGNKLDAMEVHETIENQNKIMENQENKTEEITTEVHEIKTEEDPDIKTDKNQEVKTDKNQEIKIDKNQEIKTDEILDNTEKIQNIVPDNNNSTDLNEISEELLNKNFENCAKKLPDKVDIPKHSDKESIEKNIDEPATDKQCCQNIEQNSISENSDQPFSSNSNSNKLKTYLNKYNLTENVFKIKLNNMNRLTKDKAKFHNVFSHQLSRNYLNILKRKRSIKNKNNFSDTSCTVSDDSAEYKTSKCSEKSVNEEFSTINSILKFDITTTQEKNHENAQNQNINIEENQLETNLTESHITELQAVCVAIVDNKSVLCENLIDKENILLIDLQKSMKNQQDPEIKYEDDKTNKIEVDNNTDVIDLVALNINEKSSFKEDKLDSETQENPDKLNTSESELNNTETELNNSKFKKNLPTDEPENPDFKLDNLEIKLDSEIKISNETIDISSLPEEVVQKINEEKTSDKDHLNVSFEEIVHDVTNYKAQHLLENNETGLNSKIGKISDDLIICLSSNEKDEQIQEIVQNSLRCKKTEIISAVEINSIEESRNDQEDINDQEEINNKEEINDTEKNSLGNEEIKVNINKTSDNTMVDLNEKEKDLQNHPEEGLNLLRNNQSEIDSEFNKTSDNTIVISDTEEKYEQGIEVTSCEEENILENSDAYTNLNLTSEEIQQTSNYAITNLNLIAEENLEECNLLNGQEIKTPNTDIIINLNSSAKNVENSEKTNVKEQNSLKNQIVNNNSKTFVGLDSAIKDVNHSEEIIINEPNLLETQGINLNLEALKTSDIIIDLNSIAKDLEDSELIIIKEQNSLQNEEINVNSATPITNNTITDLDLVTEDTKDKEVITSNEQILEPYNKKQNSLENQEVNMNLEISSNNATVDLTTDDVEIVNENNDKEQNIIETLELSLDPDAPRTSYDTIIHLDSSAEIIQFPKVTNTEEENLLQIQGFLKTSIDTIVDLDSTAEDINEEIEEKKQNLVEESETIINFEITKTSDYEIANLHSIEEQIQVSEEINNEQQNSLKKEIKNKEQNSLKKKEIDVNSVDAEDSDIVIINLESEKHIQDTEETSVKEHVSESNVISEITKTSIKSIVNLESIEESRNDREITSRNDQYLLKEQELCVISEVTTISDEAIVPSTEELVLVPIDTKEKDQKLINEQEIDIISEVTKTSNEAITNLDIIKEYAEGSEKVNDKEQNLLQNQDINVISEFSKTSEEAIVNIDSYEDHKQEENIIKENKLIAIKNDILLQNEETIDSDNDDNDFLSLLESIEEDIPAFALRDREEKQETEIILKDENKSSDEAVNVVESTEITEELYLQKNEVKQKDLLKIKENVLNIEEHVFETGANSLIPVNDLDLAEDIEIKENDVSIQENSTEYCTEEEVSKMEEIYCENNLKESPKELNVLSPLAIIPNLFEDDDIRNKIKKQLELLRRNTRKSTSVELIEPELQNQDEEINTTQEEIIPLPNSGPELSDVLISNEGELAIVNVVGGYVSDNEENKNEETVTYEEDFLKIEDDFKDGKKTKPSISITDKLLLNLSQENYHIIKPTKTTDITKIKGWRSKTFNVINDEEIRSSPVEGVDDLNVIDDVPPLIYFNSKQFESSVANPLPSTSSDLVIKEPGTLEQPQIQEIKPPEEVNKKSAFVSDYLETFLSTNSELKISYEVPKLVAEEGISKPEEIPIQEFPTQPVLEKNANTYKSKKSNTSKVKPKTLAEKRRMLELDRKNDLLHNMETNEQIYLKRLEYCEKRNKIEIAKNIRENMITNKFPFSRLCWNLATKDQRQFAVCNGKKIRLCGSAGGKNLIIPEAKLSTKTEPSLIKINENQVFNSASGYRPGPLSKKHKLMTNENWECQLLKMPKIKLEVYPEQNKPLPLIAQQYLQLCRQDKFIVNKDWANFAVTAVQSKETPEKPNKFEFEIPYADGRNHILVRKPIRNASPVKYPERTYSNRFPEINVDESIKDIVSDLLTYVENRELDSKLIKDDPDLDGLFKKKETEVDRPPTPIDSRVQAIIKRPNAKRNKTTFELRRLNVQVIEVDVKEDENFPENCAKDYCKLGCVCKSLRGACALIPEHCGREECMLECNCSFGTLQKGRHQITLPAGTDLLSASTVVRLQNEAKRNLAKEEREFTQTVIKANNQTIMVGGGARERTRRVPKVPKKYSNFAVDKPNPKGVSSYDKMISEGTIEEDFNEIEHDKTPPKKKSQNEVNSAYTETKKSVPIWINKDKEKPESRSEKPHKKCRVVLNKIKLDHLIPWCMVHNLYKCHCGGKAVFPQEPESPVRKEIETPVEDTEYISYLPRFGAARYQVDTIPHTASDVTDKYCARTKALPTNYYHARNKSQRFKADYAVMKQIEKKNTTFDEYQPQTNPTNRNKRKSLDDYETYSNETASFDNQDLLVPIKKKSTYIKKRESQSLQQRKRTSISEETEVQPKRPKLVEEDDDPLESRSLLERLRESHNQKNHRVIPTVRTLQKAGNLSGFIQKPKRRKTKGIMRNADILPASLLARYGKKTSPEILQLTTEDFVSPTSEQKVVPLKDEQKKRLENTHIVSSTSFIDYDRSFMGLLIPSKEWLGKFHRMLNPNDHTIIHQIRLLEWATMVRRQNCNSLQVWFNTKKYNNIILTEDRRRPSDSHLNVKTFKSYSLHNFKMPDIVASLLSGKLPGAAEKDTETYLILLFNGTYWEARGTIVLSGTTEICKQKLSLKPTPINILTPNVHSQWPYVQSNTAANAPTNKQLSLESVNGTLIIKSTPAMSVEIRNNNEIVLPVQPKSASPPSASNSELEIISLPTSTLSSPTKSEISDKTDNSDKAENNIIPAIDHTKYNIGNILAPLPTGGDLHRWFMLILENDFSVLRISFSKFHIKYTHLQTAINMARKSQKTVRIKTPPVNCPDVSENFSIYACPETSQRIFFGPYGNRNDHGLETFRYVNGKLVNTKIYNKMRGNPERKTSGYWFTHNATMKHNLNLEPNYDEGSSGSECTTAVTSIENITKPEIELVDLTGNDSDDEPLVSKSKDVEIDPLLNLLSVDFSKNIANDITIEAVPDSQELSQENSAFDTREMEIESVINVPNKEVVTITKEKTKSVSKNDNIRKVKAVVDISKKIDRKRKSISDVSQEPSAKKPTLIDSIELDDDDEEMPVLEPYNKDQNQIKSPNTQMPPLRPVNTTVSKEKDKHKNKCLYVITNIPGIGYFEIFFEKNKANRQSMYTLIKGSKTPFQTINNAIKYLHHLCTKCIYFMPKSLKVKFSIVDSSDPPDMPKFKDEYLNGYHMISERGIFNILNINTKDLDKLGFDEEEIQNLLSYKCDLLISRNVKQLGTFLYGYETAKKMTQKEILQMAPSKIKQMEQQESNLLEEKNVMSIRQQNLLVLINDLQRDIPESLRNITKQKIMNILQQKTPAEENLNWNELSDDRSLIPDLSKPNLSHQKSIIKNPLKLDSPAVVKPILSKPVVVVDSSKISDNSALITKTTNKFSPVPIGKFCRIIDGKIILLDNNSSVKSVKSPPKIQIVPKTPSVKILSPQKFQNLIKPNPNDSNSKFELLVPITGLQNPATVVGFGENTTIIPASSSSNSLMANTMNSQSKIVDLTDD